MKITIITAVCIIASFATYAQTSDAEAEAVVNLLGVQKKEAIAKLVPVTGKDSVAFWKVYDEYSTKNKETARQRLKLYESMAQAYQNMTPAIADSLARRYFINREEQEKSLQAYYKKVKDATNAVTAFEFLQAETYLLTQLRASIMQQIPTYGEVLRARKKE
jgi:hypothetical protein